VPALLVRARHDANPARYLLGISGKRGVSAEPASIELPGRGVVCAPTSNGPR